MKYSVLTFDENQYFNARLTINDMVAIEEYMGSNPLLLFFDTFPKQGDLVHILYMSIRHTTDCTEDTIHCLLDRRKLTVSELYSMVLKIFIDMGYSEEAKEVNSKPQTNNTDQKELESFKDIANSLLKGFIDNGLSEIDFWDFNFKEVHSALKSHRSLYREKAEADYMLAYMTSVSVGLMLNGKLNKMPSFQEYFPGLYSEEEVEESKRKEETRKATNNLMRNIMLFNEGKKAKEAGLDLNKK